ncbi:uncharacterized protein [Diadema setosum]|uniref:uncharacterized protein n=1 Tax=Diadema setosum TaxID=31175 RepID=UPI003B3AA96D
MTTPSYPSSPENQPVIGAAPIMTYHATPYPKTPVYSFCDCEQPQVDRGKSYLTKLLDEVDGTRCFCTCGRDLGEDCKDDDDCVRNLFCGSAATMSESSTCQSLCNHPAHQNRCKWYETCSMLPNRDIKCTLNFTHCSTSVYFPICARKEDKLKTFQNRCLMAKENFSLSESGQSSYTYDSIGQCGQGLDIIS